MRDLTAFAFERIAQAEGAIVVYPQGFEKHWNDCRGSADYAANTRNIDDPAFFEAMIGWFERELGADRGRVLATGLSNGGQMAYRLGLERPDLVLAIAPMAAGLPAPATRDCRESGKPVATAIFNGTEDPVNPFAGGLVSIFGNTSRGEVLSSQATARYWAAARGLQRRARARGIARPRPRRRHARAHRALAGAGAGGSRALHDRGRRAHHPLAGPAVATLRGPHHARHRRPARGLGVLQAAVAQLESTVGAGHARDI